MRLKAKLKARKAKNNKFVSKSYANTPFSRLNTRNCMKIVLHRNTP